MGPGVDPVLERVTYSFPTWGAGTVVDWVIEAGAGVAWVSSGLPRSCSSVDPVLVLLGALVGHCSNI